MRTSDRPALSRPGRPAPVSAPAPAASVPGPAGPAFGLPAWDGPPVRLSLVPPDRGPVRIDGAWWPRSDDLAKELLPLLAALGVRWGRITHITVDAAAWQDGPPALVLGGHTLRVKRSCHAGQREAICLVCPGVGRCDLVVVPPETPRVQAHRALGAASPARQRAPRSQLPAAY